MLKYLYIIVALSITSCQQEELEILETPQENASFLLDEELTSLMKAVVSHDGSFDDIIDQSSCFSIDLPYQVELNGALHQVNTIEDLMPITSTDVVVPVFPIMVNFADYGQQQITTNDSFETLILACSSNLLYNERITCIDFEYPINIQVYNTNLSEFETVLFEHDKMTFESIISYTQDELAAIKFPINMLDNTGVNRVITSNVELKRILLSQQSLCD